MDEYLNEYMKEGRDAAQDVLKPSRRDLEHGLELHANSIVCETYGFSPRSAIDGDRFNDMLESGASEMELVDGMENMSMTRCIGEEAERSEYINAWKATGITCIFQNAGVESQAPLEIIKRLARYTYVVDNMPDVLIRATHPDHIVQAKEQGKHCMYMSSNGVPLSQQWISLEEELRYIEVFHQLGIRMMHLTYNRRNMIGDGCAEPSNAGLSDFGVAVIKEMNRVGVIVDSAHSGHQTSLEAAQVSDLPVVASHSGCTSLNDHMRCKPDDVIRAIADTGGYIGIVAIPHFLGRTGDINAMLDHIDYVAKNFGPDYVTIGTDVAYTSQYAAAERAKVSRRRRVRNRWEAFWPEGTRSLGKRHRSLDWTNWPLFTVGLVQRGYSDDDIQKIIGGNMLRVARAHARR